MRSSGDECRVVDHIWRGTGCDGNNTGGLLLGNRGKNMCNIVDVSKIQACFLSEECEYDYDYDCDYVLLSCMPGSVLPKLRPSVVLSFGHSMQTFLKWTFIFLFSIEQSSAAMKIAFIL